MSDKYVHDKVSITVNGQKTEIPSKPHPSEDPTAYLVSHRTGDKVPISKIQQLYNVYGSYAKVAKEVGISDKTIKRYVKTQAPIDSTPSQHLTDAERKGFKERKVSNTQHVAIKASKMADTWMKSNSSALDATMTALLESIQDPAIIARASLRDRAIAWGIVTERLQKSKELGIRQDEAEMKRYELQRKDSELELRKREIAAMEKGITVNVNRNFQDVSDLVEVEESNENTKDGR